MENGKETRIPTLRKSPLKRYAILAIAVSCFFFFSGCPLPPGYYTEKAVATSERRMRLKRGRHDLFIRADAARVEAVITHCGVQYGFSASDGHRDEIREKLIDGGLMRQRDTILELSRPIPDYTFHKLHCVFVIKPRAGGCEVFFVQPYFFGKPWHKENNSPIDWAKAIRDACGREGIVAEGR